MAPSATRSKDTFDALYRAHHADVLAYFMRRIPRADAEDAAANVFTVVWRRLDEVPGGDNALRWLFGVAHHTLANHRRGWLRNVRLKHRLAGLGAASPVTPEVQVIRTVEDELLLAALDLLSWPDAEILKLATWEKLSHSSIAELLGVSEAAVGQRISRARKRLGKNLERVEQARDMRRRER